jgi:hypothetical protein
MKKPKSKRAVRRDGLFVYVREGDNAELKLTEQQYKRMFLNEPTLMHKINDAFETIMFKVACWWKGCAK